MEGTGTGGMREQAGDESPQGRTSHGEKFGARFLRVESPGGAVFQGGKTGPRLHSGKNLEKAPSPTSYTVSATLAMPGAISLAMLTVLSPSMLV